MSKDPGISIVGSIDHLPAFSIKPAGVLVVTRHWDANERWLTIKRADSQVEFTDELLRDFYNGGDNDGMYPDVDMTPNYEHVMSECRLDGACFNGALVRIRGRDHTVVYRIGEYVPQTNRWVGRWPD